MQRSVAECNASLNARNALANGGRIEIRKGAPNDIDNVVSGTVVASFILPNLAFNNASDRRASLKPLSGVLANEGNAGGDLHYVMYNSDGLPIRNGTVGDTNSSGKNLIINTLYFNAGDSVQIVNYTASEPKGTN